MLVTYLEEALCILGGVGSHYLETRKVGEPRSVALTVLSSDGRSGAVGTSEDHRALDLASGHVVGLGGTVDDVIAGLE